MVASLTLRLFTVVFFRIVVLITAVNTELLDANWQTGKYIVEYELKGKDRAEYGKQLLVNLAKDLTARNGKGFSRSNLVYMRKFYLAFPICETVSHKLT